MTEGGTAFWTSFLPWFHANKQKWLHHETALLSVCQCSNRSANIVLTEGGVKPVAEKLESSSHPFSLTHPAMCPPQLFLEPLLARNIGSKPSLSSAEHGRTNRKHEHSVHADALIILLHLLQLDRLLLTKTKLIHSPTTQSRGGTIIQYPNTLFGFLAACGCRFLRPGGASEGGRQRVILSSEWRAARINCELWWLSPV